MSVETKPVESTTKQSAEDKASSSLEHLAPSVKESMGKVKDYAPFLYNIGSRAFFGAAWGGLFGLLFFSKMRMRSFSVLYGAGFGLGMCAP